MTKNGMRGFSAGILTACAVFAFFYYLIFNPDGQSKPPVRQAPLTESAVNRYLDSHNRVALDTTDYQKYQKWQEDSAAKTPAAKSKTDNKKAAANSHKTQKAITYEINIQSGMTPGDISSQLVQAKILKSGQKSEFDSYLHNNHLEKYVQLGKFKVSSDMSFQKIAQVITKNHS
ncbi:hypothetical protein EWI07_10900 [Sporolactobacillus sp. THM7-4]|nr:hypothetical protein EWI07_10900 [Sporolactobacillus sp. THM7-4]